MSVDTFDFIGTHVMACEERGNGELFPLMAFKGITKSIADSYAQNFPGVNLIKSSGSVRHQNALEHFTRKWESNGETYAYTCSFTIDPEITDKRKRLLAIKMLYPLLLYYHYANDIDRSIALGTVRTKTNIMFQKLGFIALRDQDGELGPLAFPSLQNEECLVVVMEKFSEECVRMAYEFQEQWATRIEISDQVRKQTRSDSGMMDRLDERRIACLH